MQWMDNAACLDVDPEIFFPEGAATTVHLARKRAAEICRGCPARVDCYYYALEDSDIRYGVWAGFDAGEIRRQARRRAAATRH